jgi:Tol biopolymer transport system component
LLDLSIGYRPRGAPRLVREETGDIRGVAWTADGKEIVYVLADYGWGNYHLMRIPVRSRALPERLWYAGEQWGMGVAIAPRGNRLGYVKNLYDSDIWRIQGQTPPQTFIGSTRLELSPEYSPDGKRVVFCSDRSGQMEIWVSDTEGGNPEQLTNSEEFSGSARWSPDGRSLAFDRHLKQGWHVFVMASTVVKCDS